jgi:hypothetical protein
VIHWHPTGSRATGRNAQLGVFFDNYGVDLSDTKLVLPEGGFTVNGQPAPADFPLEYEEGEAECDGEDARLTVVVWEDARDPGSSQVYTSSFDDIPFDKDGMAMTIAFVPDDVDVEMPDSASRLAELGAADTPPPAPGETLPPSEVATTIEPTGSSEPTASSEPTETSEAAVSSEPATSTASTTASTVTPEG